MHNIYDSVTFRKKSQQVDMPLKSIKGKVYRQSLSKPPIIIIHQENVFYNILLKENKRHNLSEKLL